MLPTSDHTQSPISSSRDRRNLLQHYALARAFYCDRHFRHLSKSSQPSTVAGFYQSSPNVPLLMPLYTVAAVSLAGNVLALVMTCAHAVERNFL
ncbi:hypothetical protein PLICRDRAFT_35554, partial [Plicaturopsis crispa FD-325 SS-3]